MVRRRAMSGTRVETRFCKKGSIARRGPSDGATGGGRGSSPGSPLGSLCAGRQLEGRQKALGRVKVALDLTSLASHAPPGRKSFNVVKKSSHHSYPYVFGSCGTGSARVRSGAARD